MVGRPFRLRVATWWLLCVRVAQCAQWGIDGHWATAAVAMSLLTPNATALTRALLPEVAGDLRAIASWADEVRVKDPRYAWSAPLHYVNTPAWACGYNATRDCATQACVDGAVRNYTQRLADVRLDWAQRAEALKFLVHFVGDAHQPLHAGFARDEGGNRLHGAFCETAATNLHAVWDSRLSAKRIHDDFHGNQTTWGAALVDDVVAPDGRFAKLAPAWRVCAPSLAPAPAPYGACSAQWVNETAQAACAYAYVDADGHTPLVSGFAVCDVYYARVVLDVVELSLAKGGVRLAAVLNRVAS